MQKNILIVGGVAGGASAAARLRRLQEDDIITMFEKGPHVSFSNCCLPYHLSGTVATAEELVLMTPEIFYEQYKIDARVNQEVIKIDRINKSVLIKNHSTNETYSTFYDKLILSPGAKPIVPPIPGLDSIAHYSIRNVVDIDHLKKAITSGSIRKITVIGGGFIGIEAAENLAHAGFEVTLVEAADQIMKPFDSDMVQLLHKAIYDNGIELILNDKVVSFSENQTQLSSGQCITSDLVILAIGVLPETGLAKDCGLDIGPSGGMKVNRNYQTNDPDIYAIGDVIEVYNSLFHDYFLLPLAGPAQKQARSVADHINGGVVDNRGYIGSSVIKIFGCNAASTGLNEATIKSLALNISYDTVRVILNDLVGIMPGASNMNLKLLFEEPTGRVLGAQAIGQGNVDKRIDVIATVIKLGGTIHDLKDLELCYAPPFSTAKDVVNYAGYIASNLLLNNYRQTCCSDIRELQQKGAYIIDVRDPDELESGHIIGSVNIPLGEIRHRTNEIPVNQDVYLHCRMGQRSYNAVLALQHLGFSNVYNISGGFLGVCLHEYYHDQTLNREPIVTQYNFD